MKIWLNDPSCATELEQALRDAGCTVRRERAQTLALPASMPDADLTFFLKAWQQRHPSVEIQLAYLSGGESVSERVLEGVARRVRASLDAELPVDVRQVVLHRVFAEPQLLRDLAVRAA